MLDYSHAAAAVKAYYTFLDYLNEKRLKGHPWINPCSVGELAMDFNGVWGYTDINLMMADLYMRLLIGNDLAVPAFDNDTDYEAWLKTVNRNWRKYVDWFIQDSEDEIVEKYK